MLDAHAIVTQLLSGLTTAGYLFIVSSGLTLLFGAMRVINIAHGSFYMYAAFIVSAIVGTGSHGPGRFWLALAAAPLAVAGIGAAVDVGVMRRIYAKEHLLQLLATFALFYIFADLALRIWGGAYRSVPAPASLAGAVPLLGVEFPAYNFFVMGVAVAVGVAVWLLLQRTRFGWRIRAAVEDPELLAVAGTNVRRFATAVFTLGSLLAGIAGAVVAPLISVAPGLDSSILVEAFIVTVIGGLGSVTGAAIGALIIGIAEAIGLLTVPGWSSAFIYVAMILVLIVRPAGLLGVPERS